MSLDLDWDKLDPSLAARLVDILNRTISTVTRPSFIGPITVTALEFGTIAPELEIVDVRDIFRDFTDYQVDDETIGDQSVGRGTYVDDDEYEWVSRRGAGRGMAQQAPTYHHLPPHLRYGATSSSELYNVPPPGIHSPTDSFDNHIRLPSAARPHDIVDEDDERHNLHPAASDSVQEPSTPVKVEEMQPDLQLHLSIRHESDMRITITTALLINYPSPMFMALPIKLSVTGLIFRGQIVVAYEGSRKRLHLCIVDELDPYGPVSDRRQHFKTTDRERPAQPLPVGHRLLPSIFIESEIGQADKHVLKNVTRVEKFVQELIRKAVVDELVFPNFHTVILGK